MANNYNSIQQVPLPLKILIATGTFLKVLGFTFLAQVATALTFGLIAGEGLDMSQLSTANTELLRKAFLASQFSGAIFGLVILPLLYIYFIKPDITGLLSPQKKHLPEYFSVALLVFMASIPAMSWIIEWNKNMHLPDAFNGLEQSMAELEAQLEQLTKIIVIYGSIPSFLACMVVVAILPAISEELVFRGIMQNEFYQVFRNPHIAIWLSAFFFSFLHFQFFGFVPRLLLGALFGYLYYWSGSIYTSMFLHFTNNALSLLTLNFLQKKIINFDPDKADNFPIPVVAVSVGLSAFFLFFYYRLSKKEPLEQV